MIIVSAKTQYDRQSGFLKAWSVKTDTGAKFRIGAGGWTPGTQRMYAFGAFGIGLIKDRVAHGIGSDDSEMPALKDKRVRIRASAGGSFMGTGYASWKAKHGLNPIRDLRGAGIGGHMLDDFTVRYADDKMARLDITRQSSRQKASENERRAPWFGWSNQDVADLKEYGGTIFGSFVSEIVYRKTPFAMFYQKKRGGFNIISPGVRP